MRSKIVLFGIIASILILSLVLPGCGTKTTTTTAAPATTTAATTAPVTKTTTATTTPAATVNKYGGVYHYPLNVAVASPLGYPIETNPVEGLVAGCALERLMLTGDNGFIDPRLATSWKVDTANKSMTFNLRKGVKFHDGSDFNAAVV